MYQTPDGKWHASINLGVGLDRKRLRRHGRGRTQGEVRTKLDGLKRWPRCRRPPRRTAGPDGGGVDQGLDRDRRANPQAVYGADISHSYQVFEPHSAG